MIERIGSASPYEVRYGFCRALTPDSPPAGEVVT